MPTPAEPLGRELTSRFGDPGAPVASDTSWLIWNDDGKSRFDLFRGAGMIESFYVRVDARSSDPASRSRVVALARALECLLWPRGGRVFLEPSEGALAAALECSRARSWAVPARVPPSDEHLVVVFRGVVLGVCRFSGARPVDGCCLWGLEVTAAYESHRIDVLAAPTVFQLFNRLGERIATNSMWLHDVTDRLGEPYVEVTAQGGKLQLGQRAPQLKVPESGGVLEGLEHTADAPLRGRGGACFACPDLAD